MRVDPRFVEVYEAEHERVFQVTFALCRDRSVAEEATQEAFARALERWAGLQGHAWAAGWVMTTSLNVARRMLRRPPQLPRGLEQDPGPQGATGLWEVVGTLPKRQREAVALHYILDLPLSEVAAAMGCRVGTVKAHLAHARQALRGRLEGVSDER